MIRIQGIEAYFFLLWWKDYQHFVFFCFSFFLMIRRRDKLGGGIFTTRHRFTQSVVCVPPGVQYSACQFKLSVTAWKFNIKRCTKQTGFIIFTHLKIVLCFLSIKYCLENIDKTLLGMSITGSRFGAAFPSLFYPGGVPKIIFRSTVHVTSTYSVNCRYNKLMYKQ